MKQKSSVAIEERINNIIAEMSTDEKVAQMLQLAECATPPDVFAKLKKSGIVGSYLHVLGNETEEFIKEAEGSRMKIPPIFGIDAIHGHALLKGATVFPSQLAMACSWNEELIEKVGRATADEVAADGLNWVFSPVLCLGRDLRWGRIDETFGEDAELVSRLGKALITGYQANGLVAACAKHYLGYGEATGGRDSYDTEITERKAREIFLKPFKAAIDAGCMTFMSSYGSIDGTPLTVNHRYLTEILKNEYGFDGFIVTDWENIKSLVSGQKIAENIEDACIEGVKAGNDMSMNSYEFYQAVQNAVKKGRISEERINEAVRRILRVKARLGILSEEKNNRSSHPKKTIIGSQEHQDINYLMAIESAVLLKNDGVLPVRCANKIAVIGPNADDVRAQYGDWTYFSHPEPDLQATAKENVFTILKGIQATFSDSIIMYAKGCSIEGTETEEERLFLMESAMDCAKTADIIIAVIGDNLSENGEGRDRSDLRLSGFQVQLIEQLYSLGKPIVTVLVNGKPLILTEIEKFSNAIIETFNGGDMCGLAVAKLVRGEENFSGKLPISFAYSSSAIPCYYNQYEYWHGNKYIDVPAGSPYPFGFGLSYSCFKYSNVKLSSSQVKIGDAIYLSVTITNDSGFDGKEIVQVYFKDKFCKILTPQKSLLDYKKINIPAGRSKIVQFKISTDKLGYYNKKCEYVVDAGAFVFYVSGDGKHFIETELEVI